VAYVLSAAVGGFGGGVPEQAVREREAGFGRPKKADT
jgi:hypothetical protein